MNAKEYLKQIEVMQVKIEQKQQRLKEYRELAMCSGGFDYSKERVKASVSGGQMENAVMRYLEFEQEINQDICELQAQKDKITADIHNLEDAHHIKLLYKRYVECKKLEQVAYEMGYSYDHIREMHRNALKEFEKKMKVPTKSHVDMC